MERNAASFSIHSVMTSAQNPALLFVADIAWAVEEVFIPVSPLMIPHNLSEISCLRRNLGGINSNPYRINSNFYLRINRINFYYRINSNHAQQSAKRSRTLFNNNLSMLFAKFVKA